jgi:hypothetical protein
MTKAITERGTRARAASLLLSVSSSQATSGEVAAPSGERQRRSACWAGTADEIGKRRRPRTVGVDAAPEFIPKRNSEPIVNRGRIADDATRLEIGEIQGSSGRP